jgi:hypothetical protein
MTVSSLHVVHMDTVDSLKQPEYTGENRCIPCTVVNIGIAAVLAVAVWFLAGIGAGSVVFVATVATIYFRGYLVPGTPELTKRYLPAPVRRLFGKEPVAERTLEAVDGDASIEDRLVAAGALTDATVPELTDDFARAWTTAIEGIEATDDIDEAELRRRLGTDDVSKHASTAAVVDGNQSVRWISEAAMVADVAAGRVLEARVDDWETVRPSDRIDLFRGLRLFSRSCPSCGGAVERTQLTVDPCC